MIEGEGRSAHQMSGLRGAVWDFKEAEGFPLSLKDPFISPLDVGDAEDVDPLASCTRPRGLGDRDFDFLLGICECCADVVALSNCSS